MQFAESRSPYAKRHGRGFQTKPLIKTRMPDQTTNQNKNLGKGVSGKPCTRMPDQTTNQNKNAMYKNLLN